MIPFDLRLHAIATAAAATFLASGPAAGQVDPGVTGTSQAPAERQLAQVCFPVGQRVCAFKNGRWRNYRNRCYAQRANATSIRNGRCTAATNCATQGLQPVCGTWRGRRVTFRNLCYARRARASNLRYGRCDGGIGGRCDVRNATIQVRIPGSCGWKAGRLRFPFPYLQNGRTYRLRHNSGPIGQGLRPHGRCNFHTDIVYRCVNGRLRIQSVQTCRQARSNPRGAQCSVSN